MLGRGKVYEIYSTRTGEILYVGQTRRELWRRLSEHVSCARSLHELSAFYRRLHEDVQAGYRPGIRLVKCVSPSRLDAAERGRLRWYRRLGVKLLNGK